MTSITLYWAKWCPHCIDFKPTWENVKKWGRANGVICSDFEDIELQVERQKKNKLIPFNLIEGYPTILVTRNGKYYRVEDRNYESIIRMLGGGNTQTSRTISGGGNGKKCVGGTCKL